MSVSTCYDTDTDIEYIREQWETLRQAILDARCALRNIQGYAGYGQTARADAELRRTITIIDNAYHSEAFQPA